MSKKTGVKILFVIIITFLILQGISYLSTKNSNTTSEIFRDTTHLILTTHVKCRMDCRQITIDEIKEILQKGHVNYAKSGMGTQGDSTYALEGYSFDNQHIRVIVAPKNNELVVITCIDLNKDWPCHCY